MSIDLRALVARLANTSPRCIMQAWPRALRSLSQVLDDSDDIIFTSWAVNVSPDHSQCMVIGEPTLIKPEPRTRLLFGPLALVYHNHIVEIFDPVIHGFNNEIDVIDSKIVKPAPDAQLLSYRRPFECEQCVANLFSVSVNIYYQHGTVDILLKYPDLPSSDMFNAFNLYGICAACQRKNTIAEVDGL
jgi:hypothetical protein